jgi:hypothetical protein
MPNPAEKMILAALLLSLILGCSSIPLTEGGLVVGKDTTAGIEDLGVARLTKGF